MPVTPNMNLSLPTPTVSVGPQWASDVNTALTTVDDHDHSSGKGRKVTPAGISINAELDINSQNLKNINAAKLKNLATALVGVDFACSIQFVAGNFVIVNGGGTQVQITSGNSIVSNTVVAGNPLMPAGTVLDFAGSVIPIGFLSASGQAVSRTAFVDLFNAIGTIYGSGDGSTTFNLPNFNGRASVGSGTYLDPVSGTNVTRSVSQLLGAATHILTTAQMPPHTHIQDAHAHFENDGLVPGTYGIGGYVNQNASAPRATTAAVATNQLTGGGEAHNIMQPSLVINKMIKT